MDMMDGPQPGDSERNVAEHVRRERELRGWSTGELARRVTDVGCPMSQSAVWRIENGEPRRKISVDELVGFAKVFDKKIDDLLQPGSDEYPETVVEEYIQAWIVAEEEAWWKRVGARQAFADVAAVVSAFPGALPGLHRLVEKAIEGNEASYLQTEIDGQIPEISRYLASKGSHDSFMSNPVPLVEYWQRLGMTYEEMFAEASRLHLHVPFAAALGRMVDVEHGEGTLGQKLREARVIRGMTVEQLSTQTRVRPAVIEAIERDDFAVMGDASSRHVYARGHIRVLSRALSLDTEPLLEQYEEEHGYRSEGKNRSASSLFTADTGEKPRKRVVRVKKPKKD